MGLEGATEPAARQRTSSGRRESDGLRRATMMVAGPVEGWNVARYAGVIERVRNDDERCRMILHDLLRRFHRLAPVDQERSLEEPPRLTGTKWDAMLAGAAEFAAMMHGYPVPAWCDEEERMLARCWLPLAPRGGRFPGAAYRDAVGAFLRHGVLVRRSSSSWREGLREYDRLDGPGRDIGFDGRPRGT